MTPGSRTELLHTQDAEEAATRSRMLRIRLQRHLPAEGPGFALTTCLRPRQTQSCEKNPDHATLLIWEAGGFDESQWRRGAWSRRWGGRELSLGWGLNRGRGRGAVLQTIAGEARAGGLQCPRLRVLAQPAWRPGARPGTGRQQAPGGVQDSATACRGTRSLPSELWEGGDRGPCRHSEHYRQVTRASSEPQTGAGDGDDAGRMRTVQEGFPKEGRRAKWQGRRDLDSLVHLFIHFFHKRLWRLLDSTHG